MMFQQLPHLQAGAPQSRLCRAWGNLERAGGFADRKAPQVVKLQNGPVWGREPRDHLRKNAPQFVARIALFRVWTVILKRAKETAVVRLAGVIQGNFFDAPPPDLH